MKLHYLIIIYLSHLALLLHSGKRNFFRKLVSYFYNQHSIFLTIRFSKTIFRVFYNGHNSLHMLQNGWVIAPSPCDAREWKARQEDRSGEKGNAHTLHSVVLVIVTPVGRAIKNFCKWVGCRHIYRLKISPVPCYPNDYLMVRADTVFSFIVNL